MPDSIKHIHQVTNVCVICNSMHRKQHSVRSPLYTCEACGHMVDHTWPEIDLITTKKYVDSYRDHASGKAGLEMQKNKARWETIMKYAKGCRSLLDFGCGFFAMKAYAPPDHGFTTMAGFDVGWQTGYYDERVLDEKYDVLLAYHIIEHLIDPYRFLKRIDHEYLFLCIPWIEGLDDPEGNAGSWGTFNQMWSGVHHQFFTRKSLDIYLKGYDLLEENFDEGAMDHPDTPEVYVTRVLRKKRGRD